MSFKLQEFLCTFVENFENTDSHPPIIIAKVDGEYNLLPVDIAMSYFESRKGKLTLNKKLQEIVKKGKPEQMIMLLDVWSATANSEKEKEEILKNGVSGLAEKTEALVLYIETPEYVKDVIYDLVYDTDKKTREIDFSSKRSETMKRGSEKFVEQMKNRTLGNFYKYYEKE